MNKIVLLLEKLKDVKKYAEKIKAMDLFNELIYLDDTKTKKYVFPFLKLIHKDGFTYVPDEFTSAFNFFKQFNGIKFNKDPLTFKNLNDFLEFVIKNKDKELSRRELKRVNKTQIQKIFENENALVIRIKGKQASCIYGAGTRWCITQKDQLHFESYVEQGNIFYFVLHKKLKKSENDKYKLAVAIDRTRKWKIFDATDEELSNTDGWFDEFLEENKIPYDIFKYVKPTLFESYPESIELLSDNSIKIIKSITISKTYSTEFLSYKISEISENASLQLYELGNINLDIFPKKCKGEIILDRCGITLNNEMDIHRLTLISCASKTEKGIIRVNSLNISYCSNFDNITFYVKSELEANRTDAIYDLSPDMTRISIQNETTTNISLNLQSPQIELLSLRGVKLNLTMKDATSIHTLTLSNCTINNDWMHKLTEINVGKINNCLFANTALVLNKELKIRQGLTIINSDITSILQFPNMENIKGITINFSNNKIVNIDGIRNSLINSKMDITRRPAINLKNNLLKKNIYSTKANIAYSSHDIDADNDMENPIDVEFLEEIYEGDLELYSNNPILNKLPKSINGELIINVINSPKPIILNSKYIKALHIQYRYREPDYIIDLNNIEIDELKIDKCRGNLGIDITNHGKIKNIGIYSCDRLDNLVGLPTEIKGDLNIHFSVIASMKGIPKIINHLSLYDCHTPDTWDFLPEKVQTERFSYSGKPTNWDNIGKYIPPTDTLDQDSKD